MSRATAKAAVLALLQASEGKTKENAQSDYANDIALTIKGIRGTDTNDYIEWDFTKLRMLPIDEKVAAQNATSPFDEPVFTSEDVRYKVCFQNDNIHFCAMMTSIPFSSPWLFFFFIPVTGRFINVSDSVLFVFQMYDRHKYDLHSLV